ncbi:hypothetical protein, variant [Aphanomyces astaci]|uniref:HMG box domain-containing protein n=1 Tax=Aphanomyces astaci TaxID=112090 RepID=W4FZK0_APHAT|nr:hypothetical protein, variant [Aphanomyces astaci]ETV72912.1 hypothetical protein, variant [Aphanomyces astaci]|eukprot:XP_009837698.1 hypothetical protein, variant [Aphanomyces astaci]
MASGKSKVKMWKNAYVHFADKKRMELTKEHPSMDNATISRELGRLWKGLPADERNVWINLAAYDRARYVAECHMEATLDPSPLPGKASALSTTSITVDTSPEYDMSSFSMMSPHPQSSSQPTTTYGDPLSQFSLPLLDTTPPSLPSSSKKRKRSTSSSGSHVQLAYYYFRRTKRDSVLAANPSMLSADVNREIGRLWQALRPEQKQPWTQLAIAHAKSNQSDQSVGAANVRPKLKDPLAPKAPRSAFHFVVEARRMERPDMTYKEVTKEAAHMWRHLPDDKRAPWIKLERQDRLRYEQQIKLYKAPSYARDIVHSTDEASTKPQSAYAHFFREKRTLYPDLSFVDVTRELSRQWKRMAVDAKRPWLQKALDDKLQKKNRGAHHSISSAHPTEQQQLSSLPSLLHPRLSRRKPRIGPTRPKSAFVHFQLHTRHSMPDVPYKEYMQTIAAMWKATPDEGKRPWQQLAKEDSERYTRECAAASETTSRSSATTTMDPSTTSGALAAHNATPGGAKSPLAARLRYGFACFVQAKKHDLLATTPHLTHNELLHEVGKLWRGLSPMERQPWRELLDTPKTQQVVDPQDPTTSTACSALEADDSTHLELMEGLWGDDASVTTSMFYEDDLSQSHHHLSLPMMEDMDGMQHHNHPHHSSEMHLQ